MTIDLDPALEAQEAQRRYALEEERIELLCEKYEGHGMCSNLTPVGDEHERNWGQCHVCEEWGIVHCDFGIFGSRALCEKHLMLAVGDRLQHHINVYGCSRVYGGPEEGGWYYSVGEPLLSLPLTQSFTNDQLDELRLMAKERAIDFGNALGFDWNDCYENICVLAELRPGRYWPLERPHYE